MKKRLFLLNFEYVLLSCLWAISADQYRDTNHNSNRGSKSNRSANGI